MELLDIDYTEGFQCGACGPNPLYNEIVDSYFYFFRQSRHLNSRTIHILQVREKAFREMKKDVGMTTAQKSKETRRMESLFCISSQQSLHIRRVASDYSVVMYVYVGIVGWIYRTKIPSFLFPYFFEQ